MSDIYINLDESYTASGLGTALSPYNRLQFQGMDNGMDYESVIETRFLKGQAHYPYNDSNNTQFEISSVGNPIYKGWDLVKYGPPSFYYDPTISLGYFKLYSYPSTLNAAVVIRDLVVTHKLISLSFSNGIQPTVSGSIKNCYLDYTNQLTIQSTSNISTLKVQGCSFIGRKYISGPPMYFIGTTCNFQIEDCIFVAVGDWTAETEMEINLNSVGNNFIFNNCYFSPNIIIIETGIGTTWDTNAGAPPSGYFPTATFINCQFGFNFGTSAFPTAAAAFPSSKQEFLYSIFNLPEITDATILARWEEEDYNTGLFGDTRLSVGALSFSIPEPEPSEKHVPCFKKHRSTIQSKCIKEMYNNGMKQNRPNIIIHANKKTYKI